MGSGWEYAVCLILLVVTLAQADEEDSSRVPEGRQLFAVPPGLGCWSINSGP